ncbi:MAG TPA: hypothetical protein VKX25_02315 [Bryobacteraceae bacterium]|jgi:hypothetical protein|nr:hypothetical protein [Bryobacteraceae bacterium]
MRQVLIWLVWTSYRAVWRRKGYGFREFRARWAEMMEQLLQPAPPRAGFERREIRARW